MSLPTTIPPISRMPTGGRGSSRDSRRSWKRERPFARTDRSDHVFIFGISRASLSCGAASGGGAGLDPRRASGVAAGGPPPHPARAAASDEACGASDDRVPRHAPNETSVATMAIVRMTFMAGLPRNQELREREAQTVEPLVAHDADVSLVSFLDAQLRADVVIQRVDLHVPGAGVRHVEPDAAGAGAVADVEDAVALWIDAQLED